MSFKIALNPTFRRALQRLKPVDPALTTKMLKLSRYLGFHEHKFWSAPYFKDRIEYHFGVNRLSRKQITRGFESTKNDVVTHKINDMFDEKEDKKISVSQAIIFTEYKKMNKHRGFAMLIHGRIQDPHSNLPIVFGVTGDIDDGGVARIYRLEVPKFGKDGKMTGLRDLAITEDNIRLSLTYAKLCAFQIYADTPLTPREAWDKAEQTFRKADHKKPPEMAVS